ncbi:integral membrane protein PTH11 [Fusarium sp. NRRL 25303]|nr:integral membrane protein PTH11 [Fusarium sp. NRRL 25303]
MNLLPPDVASETKGPAMMASMYSFTALSCLAVGFVFAYVACWTAAILAGSGRHQATLTVDEFDRSVFFLMIGLIPGVLSLALPKFAVVNLLVKILFPSPRHVRLLWGLAIANLVLMLGAFGVRFSECDPPEAQFTLYAPAKCRSSTAVIVYSVIVGSFSAVVDFYLALYPAVVLWSLQLHLKKKLALSVALGFGVCAGCAAIRKVMMVPGNLTDKVSHGKMLQGVL